jgi:hypothetical protein
MCELVFTSDRDAAMRLNGTVVMFEGEPVYVAKAGIRKTAICPLGENDTIDVPTNELDLKPILIGNVQIGGSHMYIQRSPTRRWKQGLHRENIEIGNMPEEIPNKRVDLNKNNVRNAIINNFGDVIENIKKVLDGRNVSSALNRHWAVANIKGIYRLMYKDNLVGFVDEGEVVISKKYFFLKEDLLEVLNG